MPVNHRAPPSGINLDIQRKKAAKYPKDIEIGARKWVEQVVGEPLKDQEIGSHHFAESLKDGVVLCKLINKIVAHFGSPQIKKINTSSMAFKQMENIGNFVKFAEEFGVPKESLFQTVDLYEERDVGMVVTCLDRLAGVATKKGYPIQWGIAVADPNKRDFTKEQLEAGKNIIGLQAGTNKGANQSGISFGSQRKM
ncbi:muscle-specific protein 20-like isoform X1 [Lytechinus variegatus]|uniref:muscle-specific protein 20-like isoform X1 n=1 Tax=Lytechinus variegatus TaxID=7654 RepID=UPI001BB15AD3|nr:muscle-specific protein 20-like isoform X1 [Lytechinus variegatus]